MKKQPDLWEIAYHEAGHAVIHWVLGIPQRHATIKPDPNGRSLGHVEIRRPRWFREPRTPKEEERRRLYAENEILALLAGRIAQSRYAGKRISWGFENDYQQVRNLVSVISYHNDVSFAFLKYCEKQTVRMVEANWPQIAEVAKQLMTHTTLDSSQIQHIIASIPPEVLMANSQQLTEKFHSEEEKLMERYKKLHPETILP